VAVGIHCMMLGVTIGLHLPSRFGTSVWWRRSPSVFSV
jgi:hypothetical protein